MLRSLALLLLSLPALAIVARAESPAFPVRAVRFAAQPALPGVESGAAATEAAEMDEEVEEGEEEEEADEIETDRDSFTPATSLTSPRRMIVESAWSFIDNRDAFETHSFPELLVRYGLADGWELRLGANYEVGGAGNPISGSAGGDLSESLGLETEAEISYGLKVRLREGERFRSAVIVQGATPTSGVETATEFTGIYVCGWEIASGWTWDSALRLRASSLEGERFLLWAPSTVLKIPLGERWKVHAEYFGVFSAGLPEERVLHFFSPGAHYLLTSDWELGARVGWGLNEPAPRFFVNVGGGYRF